MGESPWWFESIGRSTRPHQREAPPSRGASSFEDRAAAQRPPVALELPPDLDEDLEHRLHGGRAEGAGERAGDDVAHGRPRRDLADDDVVADVDQREVGDHRDAHARGDEALDRRVVVGLEADPRLEPGRGAGAQEDRAVRARSATCRPATRRRAGPRGAAATCPPSGGPWAGRRTSGRRASAIAVDAVVGRALPAGWISSAMSTSPARSLSIPSGGSAGVRVTSTPGWRSRKRAIAARDQVAPARRERRQPHAAAAQPARSPRARPRRRRAGRG